MRKKADFPFNEFYLYGPIWHQRIGRYMINLVPIEKEKNKRTSMSYARYVMSVNLKRILDKNENVDHVNGDKTDDRFENLQILSRKENNKKAIKEQNRTRLVADIVCPMCGTTFTRNLNKVHQIHGRSNNSFCSQECHRVALKFKNIIDKAKIIKIYRI